jgi:microcystin-dependent protein
VPAAGNFSCQWQTSAATWERVGSGAGAVDAEEIRLRVLLSWVAPPGMAATQNFVMKPKVIDVTVPRHYFDASNLPVTPQQMCLDLGGTWNSAGAPRCILVPPGAVMAFVTACPSGWAAANGSSGRPDLRGRNVIGSGGTPVSQASASGLQTLSVANMPAHNHAGSNAAPAGDHSHSYSQWTPAGDTSLGLVNSPTVANTERGVNSGGGSTSGAGSHSHSLNIATQGGGQAFSVMDPYTVLNYCVKL